MFQVVNGLILGFVAAPTCPSNAEEIKRGTHYGFWFAFTVGLGAVTGDAIVLMAILFGLVPVIEAYPILNIVLWFLGGVVLLWISWGILKEVRTVTDLSQPVYSKVMPSSWNQLAKAFWTGTAITTFNPFSVVWWIGLMAPMLQTESDIPVVFSLAVLIGSLVWFMILAILLHIGRRWLNKMVRQWILVISGLVMVVYGCYFLWQAIEKWAAL